MLQSDAFARQSAYPVDQSTNDWFFVNYDYWIQVTFDLICRVIDTAVTKLKKITHSTLINWVNEVTSSVGFILEQKLKKMNFMLHF